MQKLKQIISSVYGQQDLGAHPYFLGGYINFGFWRNIPITKSISIQNRIKASRALYFQLFELLNLGKEDIVLEIACGHGLGSAIALTQFGVKQVVGLDITPEQVDRAKKKHALLIKKTKALSFCARSADKTNLPSKKFTKIFSIEAAQHFPSMKAFLLECKRLLKNKGQVGITTFFPESNKSLKEMKRVIPELDLKMHPMTPLDHFFRLIYETDFRLLHFERIGSQVFPGFHRWTKESGKKEKWGPVWHKAYQHRLIDYVNIILETGV